ncbi:MAG: bifunctional molybdenum cofactor biosynthesis protein MoaC/MoaB [Melioribacteraceae bacterium]|nr:bifunctional molybdenum cofactor biosynthesis protein MoaC/MoaB [Melioribacteraceae bacterium]
MIDVSHKFNTLRYAKAEGVYKSTPDIIEKIKNKRVPKGDVLEIARGAGISAAKRTSDWIVFCHPIPMDYINLSYEIGETEIVVSAEAKTVWKTGVEMEAMTAVSAALLNMYDMTKPLTDDITIGEIKLVKKKGGKSDFKDKFEKNITAAVLVISDSTFEGKREDKSGKVIKEFLDKQLVDVKVYDILPDSKEKITSRIKALVDDENIQLVITTGGTGLGPKDITPDVTAELIDKRIPGIEEAIRKHGKDRTPFAMLSRELAGLRGKSIIINLPGSSRGVKESMDALFPGLLHGFPMIWGGGHEHGNKKTKEQ